MTTQKIAIIGTGTIGQTIATELENHLHEDYQLVGMMKRSKTQVESLATKFKTTVVTNFTALLQLKPDFIIEAASVEAVQQYGQTILTNGIHFIPLSIGALADASFYAELQQTAKTNQAILYIPFGAIGGFDFMRKMTLADPPKVAINTYKSPESLANAPFLKGRSLSKQDKEVVFDGSAEEAIKGFPQNMNVAVATGLATVGPDQVRTIIHSDPELKVNIHEITIENKEGKADIRFAAQPSKNARTSSITPWSVISLLKNITDPVRFF